MVLVIAEAVVRETTGVYLCHKDVLEAYQRFAGSCQPMTPQLIRDKLHRANALRQQRGMCLLEIPDRVPAAPNSGAAATAHFMRSRFSLGKRPRDNSHSPPLNPADWQTEESWETNNESVDQPPAKRHKPSSHLDPNSNVKPASDPNPHPTSSAQDTRSDNSNESSAITSTTKPIPKHPVNFRPKLSILESWCNNNHRLSDIMPTKKGKGSPNPDLNIHRAQQNSGQSFDSLAKSRRPSSKIGIHSQESWDDNNELLDALDAK